MTPSDAPEALPHLVDRLADLARASPHLAAFEVRGEDRQDGRYQTSDSGLGTRSTIRLGGVSLRGWVNGGSAYAYTTDPNPDALPRVVEDATRLAMANAGRGRHTFPPQLSRTRSQYHSPVDLHPDQTPHADVRAMLRRAHDTAKAEEPTGTAISSFGFTRRRVLTTDSCGSWVDSEFVHSTLLTQVILRDAGRVADYMEVSGGERGLRDYERHGIPEAVAADAARYAREGLVARAAPAGRFRVLTDHHLTGILAHESFGHLTEYDAVASGWSLLKGRRGDLLADEHVSVVDAPTSPDGRPVGISLPYDNEGTPGREVRVLDHGRLAGFLHLRDTAPQAGDAPTGNGRALDIRFPPIVRMRNTYFEPGDLQFEEALELLDDGLYLCGGRGGAPHSDGSFLFTSQRAYRVENGQIAAPLRGPSISGNILSFLRRVEGATRDFDLFTNYFAGCGKWEQSFLNVGVGGPHLLVGEALVGGHAG